MMKILLAVCLISLLISPSKCQLMGFIDNAKKVCEKAVNAITTPIEQTIVANTLKNCEEFKSIFGVSYHNLTDMKKPNVSGLTIDLWSGHNKKVFKLTNASRELLAAPEFDPKKPVMIFLHGFLSTSEGNAPLSVTKAFVQKGGYNVMALDSSSMIKHFYLQASTCVIFIGCELGSTLARLYEGGVDPKSIHLVGHSLGSHIAGFAGKKFHDLTGKTIGRISGLDPAGPCFFRERSDHRLGKTDADFVDVIHCDSGVLGITDPIGHIDFYPNNGESQPGCITITCSHSRAWELFCETVLNPESHPAVKCEGWDMYQSGDCNYSTKAFMGLSVDQQLRGIFFLETNSSYPFGLGKHQINSLDSAHSKLVSR